MPEQKLSIEEALNELREMFPMAHNAQWRDFQIRARVYFGEYQPLEIVGYTIDGCGRRWRDYTWEGKTVADCMAQIRAWKEQSNGEG